MILARHTALNATATIIAAAGRLAITTLMARRLGPDAFGAVVFAQWCAETIAAVASLGLPNVLARYCPELALASVADRRLRIRQMALAAAATLLLATVASVAIFTWLDGGKGAAAVAAPAAWCLAALAASLGSALGAGLLRFDLILASNAAFVSVGAAAVMTMTRPGEPQGAMLVWTAASLAAVATMVGGLALTRRASVAVGEQGLAPARELRSYAVNTWIGGLAATQLWTRGEVGVVRAFAPPAELARYGAATTLSALVMQGVNLFQGGMTPHLAKAWSQGDRDRIERLVRGLSGVTFAAALCGSLFVVLFAREIVAGLFGGRFEGAAPALILVSLGTTAAGAGTVNMAMQFATEGRFQRNANLLGAVALVGLAALLTPLFGIVGAATARLVVILGNGAALVWMLGRVGFGRLSRDVGLRWAASLTLLTALAAVDLIGRATLPLRAAMLLSGVGAFLALWYEARWLTVMEALLPGLGRGVRAALGAGGPS